MKDKEPKSHVLSVRVTDADFAKLEQIAVMNHETTQEAARRALEMIFRAYSGCLLDNKKD